METSLRNGARIDRAERDLADTIFRGVVGIDYGEAQDYARAVRDCAIRDHGDNIARIEGELMLESYRYADM